MAYNHQRAENEWLRWKDEEEKRLRELGMDENAIQELHTYDWQQFNRERQYQQRRTDQSANGVQRRETQEHAIYSVERLLDGIEDEQLFHVLHTADKLTLEMLVLRMNGYTSREIAEKTGIPELAINNRIARLRKKIKKTF